jgi:hypothetical protein
MLKLVTNEHYMPRVIPPPEVIDERNRRLGTPYQSIVAAMCGDPLPGYSALDRRANG